MEDNTTETTETNTQQTPPPAEGGDTGAQNAPVVDPPATPVVPDGYVPATEVESERTARTAAETARTEAEARAIAAETRARATEIKLAAQGLNFNDPADAERFIGADVEDIGAALTEVLKTKPYLAKQEAVAPVVTPTSPTNPARTEALTAEMLRGMSASQIAVLPWAQVSAALKVGA